MKAGKVIIFIIGIGVFACSQDRKEDRQHIINQAANVDSIPKNTATDSKDQIAALINQYEDPDRVDWQDPALVISQMGSLKDKVVADIGAGSGYFTFRIANEASQVIAIDIEKEMLAFIDERKTGLRPNIRSRIETRWVTPDDPGLKNGEADMALMVNTYSNIAERIEYLRKLRVGLADNGQVVIVDFKLGDLPTGPPDSLKVSPVLAMQELTEAGFSNTTIDSTSLVYQYLIISNK